MFDGGLSGMFGKKMVKPEGLSTPNPDRAAAFVAEAKAAKGPAPVKMVSGRYVYGETPMASDAEAREFRGLPNLPKKGVDESGQAQNTSETSGDSLREMEDRMRGRMMRSGKLFTLDETVETAPPFSDSQRGPAVQDSESGFSDSTREALSLAEQKEQYASLSEEVNMLEAELEAVPVEEPLTWKEKNDMLKPKRAELEALGKLLTNSAKTDQPQ